MVAFVDPIVRLSALNEYMAWWISKWPYVTLTFDQYFKRHYPEVIPGTVEYARDIATHCFYCDDLFTRELRKSKTIDHYEPSSKFKTERFVISCFDCNNNKKDTDPRTLVSQMTNAELKGRTMWGRHGKKLKYIAGQIQKITNDRIYNMGPKIYYIKK